MENNNNNTLNKLLVKHFGKIELLLIAVSLVAFTMFFFYHMTGSGFLFIVSSIILSMWYELKMLAGDYVLRFKGRIVYFCCSIACVANIFAAMWWPGYQMILIGGLAAMAVAWGVFLWSRQRDKNHPMTSTAMVGRLILYTASCLLWLVLERFSMVPLH